MWNESVDILMWQKDINHRGVARLISCYSMKIACSQFMCPPGLQDVEPALFSSEQKCSAVFTSPERLPNNGETTVVWRLLCGSKCWICICERGSTAIYAEAPSIAIETYRHSDYVRFFNSELNLQCVFFVLKCVRNVSLLDRLIQLLTQCLNIW